MIFMIFFAFLYFRVKKQNINRSLKMAFNVMIVYKNLAKS